ncbi:hypothetical protein Kisp01_31770 [Kineosporia sp. NBRC 101677]|nr:hypothetical protein Kisp01_31770 [Kineosporia sp. NBRC 101677]
MHPEGFFDYPAEGRFSLCPGNVKGNGRPWSAVPVAGWDFSGNRRCRSCDCSIGAKPGRISGCIAVTSVIL